MEAWPIYVTFIRFALLMTITTADNDMSLRRDISIASKVM